MKALLSGVGVAVVAGLLMGAAMKPNLSEDDRPAGPQMLAGWSGQRSSGPFDDGGAYSAYSGQIPDYVTGTDWKKSLAAAVEPAPAEPEPRQAAVNEAAPVVHLARLAADEAPAAAPVTYPSLAGGAPDTTDLPPPPPPEDQPASDDAPAAS